MPHKWKYERETESSIKLKKIELIVHETLIQNVWWNDSFMFVLVRLENMAKSSQHTKIIP